MTPSPADLTALAELLDRSATLFAATADADGLITWANPALDGWAGVPLAGQPAVELVAAPQRPAFARALETATGAWSVLTFGFHDGSPRPAEDRQVLFRREGDMVHLVAEPAVAEHDR